VVLGSISTVGVAAKRCAVISLPMALDRHVTGRVLTQAGEPAAGLSIELVPVRPRYADDWLRADGQAPADAEGRYAIDYPPGGDYNLGVSIVHSPSPRNPYTRWFYPGTDSPAQAAVVRIPDHPSSQTFDLVLPEPQHERIVNGAVHWPDGRPAVKVDVFLQDPRYPTETAAARATTDANGNFSIQAWMVRDIACSRPPGRVLRERYRARL
jgi:hypothetical protein